ncbi:thiamine pyrophosphate-binding protein [Brevibacillus choshinensis]|uniref:thiamine pyrophosphate-binding protein n=1 Tax=Brevibacillus choshinensis TaxID=54911 RepID=UPI002E1D7F1B|nr:thiamine pyrophosphate-binding protein [Brevibacillus choshinensis]MED4584375.1 thiamine pyrophosphate-binding protein [Brevibacillus choshinensis]MED4784316.1 thiamine pyrophosphate-binding protein [Brevibacillus choshinensis]
MTTNGQMEFTTADAVVAELVRAGVEVVFGVVSIHNMPIYDALLREGSIRIVCSRGESGAANMADGYARSTGKLGVVITSTGSGAGNAAGSLVEAWAAGTPVLHLTGEVSSKYLGTGRGYIHECKDQLSMMNGCCKEAYRLRKPEQAAAVVRQAIQNATTAPRGPVSLEIPIDFQSAIIPNSVIEVVQAVTAQKVAPHIPAEVTKLVAAARRPVIWAGGGVISSEASAELTKLAELTGAAVITSQSGKGSIPEDHPQCIGHFAAYEDVKALLKQSDLLISVGVRFRGNETANWKVTAPEAHISIDADWSAFNRNYEITHGLLGEAKAILNALNEELAAKSVTPDAEYVTEVKSVREKIRGILRDTLGPYEKFVDGMRKVLPKDAILVRDVTVPANVWGSRLFEIYEPRTSIHASGGGIGQGLPTALGAQAGQLDRVVVLMAGDGGYMLNVGEMPVAVQENLPLIVVLFDDQGYGVLRNIQDAAYGRQVAVDLVSPDFVMMAKSMGFEAERIGSPEEFVAELEAAVARRKPSMIVVDMNAVGPMAKPFGGPPGAADSFKPKKL